MTTSSSFYFIIVLSAFLLVNACTQSSINLEEEAYLIHYFDLAEYAEEEVARLNEEAYQFRKTISINGETETVELETLDLITELNFLSKNNINRPALTDRYQVDSIMNTKGDLQRIVHEATDEDLALQYLAIDFDEAQEVSQIEMRTGSNSRLLTAVSEAIYKPNEGYRLTNKQKILMFGKQDMVIEVTYLKEN